MTLSDAEYDQVTTMIADLEAKRDAQTRYEASVAEYLNGGSLSGELQDVLRTWMAGELPALLVANQSSIDTDLVAIRAFIPDYA